MAETIEPMAPQIDQQELARELVARARADGVQLIGEGGLLTGLTKSVLECAVEEEMSPHLGYDKHDPARPQWRQLAQRASREDGAHRDRSGEHSLPKLAADQGTATAKAVQPSDPLRSRQQTTLTGSGVCQDSAHTVLALWHLLGLPGATCPGTRWHTCLGRGGDASC